jgi:hypothetical protein
VPAGQVVPRGRAVALLLLRQSVALAEAVCRFNTVPRRGVAHNAKSR